MSSNYTSKKTLLLEERLAISRQEDKLINRVLSDLDKAIADNGIMEREGLHIVLRALSAKLDDLERPGATLSIYGLGYTEDRG